MDYEIPKVAVSWFEIDSLNAHNLRAHLEQTPGQQAYVGEQFALAEKNYLDAEDRYKQVRGQRYLALRQETVERISSKHGRREEINVTDTMAKHLCEADPQTLSAAAEVAYFKHVRDTWREYQNAMRSKVSCLLCLAGIYRDELEASRKIQ